MVASVSVRGQNSCSPETSRDSDRFFPRFGYNIADFVVTVAMSVRVDFRPRNLCVQVERLHDDLSGLFQGEIALDSVHCALYSTDASIFQVMPAAVVAPRDEADLQHLVRYASEQHLPLIPRGAGTSLAGQALGAGIVVDLARHFRQILAIGSDTVRVQTGVVLDRLQVELAKQGRRFAPAPDQGICGTVGGLLASNRAGPRAYRHGTPREHIAALRVVWDNGDADQVAGEFARVSPGQLAVDRYRTRAVVAGLVELLEGHAGLLERRCSGEPSPGGYQLQDVYDGRCVHLPRLLTGSEGTLALFTEATLKTVPLPHGRAAVLFGFETLELALRAAERVRAAQPVACELLDRRLLALGRRQAAVELEMLPRAAEAVLLVEFEAATPQEAREAVEDLIDWVQWRDSLARVAIPAYAAEHIERLWRVRDAASPNLHRFGQARPLPFIEDIAFPPDQLRVGLAAIQKELQQREMTAAFLLHPLTGQVDVRPFLDLNDPADRDRMWALAEGMYARVLDLGASLGGQHGIGLSRTPWVARQTGDRYPVLRELKAIFDPQHLLNPGKIVGPDPSLPAWPLRPRPSADALPTPRIPLETARLHWATSLADEVERCNQCGDCRPGDITRRMCPLFHVDHDEGATPRAKANLLRQLLYSPETELEPDQTRAVADLCIHCKMCAVECPSRVDIPKLMVEAKAAHLAEHGLTRSKWVLARVDIFATLGANFPMVANAVLRNRSARWLLEKLLGIARQRHLPRFADRSFLRQARRRGWTRKPTPNHDQHRVAYFVDHYANVNNPGLGQAAVAVLKHQGVAVHVPLKQRGSGMAPLVQGDVEQAREMAVGNIRVLAELVREGYTIVCSEPSAAVMLTQDYPNLIPDADTQLVAGNTVELMNYLAQRYADGQLKTDFRPFPVQVGHHVPCHVKALGQGVQGPRLLQLIPEFHIHTIDVSCSGMGGTYGLSSRSYATSLAVGAPMLEELARPRYLLGSSECSACRMQMHEGTGKQTYHPVQYLAHAYGLVNLGDSPWR